LHRRIRGDRNRCRRATPARSRSAWTTRTAPIASTPPRRRADGSHERIDWDTAIREIAAKLADIRARHGGESILFYGGGSQGNHLGGTYADSTLKALGVKYR
jgi:anaerobic selenocysteine-containing dehydrogenase